MFYKKLFSTQQQGEIVIDKQVLEGKEGFHLIEYSEGNKELWVLSSVVNYPFFVMSNVKDGSYMITKSFIELFEEKKPDKVVIGCETEGKPKEKLEVLIQESTFLKALAVVKNATNLKDLDIL